MKRVFAKRNNANGVELYTGRAGELRVFVLLRSEDAATTSHFQVSPDRKVTPLTIVAHLSDEAAQYDALQRCLAAAEAALAGD
jgi:hypothetical protein